MSRVSPEDLERLRRSLAMLQPGTMAVSREQAIELLRDLADLQRRMDKLRSGLRRLPEDSLEDG